jgi:hypothetical protein
VTVREKQPEPVESAFIKALTRSHLLHINPGPSILEEVPSNQLLKVKVKIDTDPPGDFETEVRPVLDPLPFNVRIVSLPGLFAGKMHCVFCRKWRSKVKGGTGTTCCGFPKMRVLSNCIIRIRESGNPNLRWNNTCYARMFFSIYIAPGVTA